MHTLGSKLGGYICLLVIQATFIVVYGIFVRYEDRLLPGHKDSPENEPHRTGHVSSYARKYTFIIRMVNIDATRWSTKKKW